MKYLGVFLLAYLFALSAFAHQSPTTIVLLDAGPKQLNIELQVPLSELSWAINMQFDENSKNTIEKNKAFIIQYFLSHLKIYNSKNEFWKVEYKDMVLEQAEYDIKRIGLYQELKVFLVAIPPNSGDNRHFTFDYTGVMHQVASHITYVYLRNDWQAGSFEQDHVFGIIRTEIEDNKIHPLVLNLEKGNAWKGFKGMFWLGVAHIKEGTDHLLFILTLLLPACLLVNNRKWAEYGGLKHSIFKLLKIVTAFTIGHSITLLIGVFNVVKFNIQIIEVLIAFSILITAIHAIKPLFYNKELFIAIGFGFIHGLAFSQTLQNLHLSTNEMLLSVAGFNVGIEIMQLFVILLIIPSFIMMSQTHYFKFIKNTLASFVVFIAAGWILERISHKTNFIVQSAEIILVYTFLIISLLYAIAILTYFLSKSSKLKS
jgi:hypothetical protein